MGEKTQLKYSFINNAVFVYESLKNCFYGNDLIDNRIYPIVAETSALFPFILYQRNDVDFQFITKDNSINDLTFTITIVSDTYMQLLELLDILYQYYQLAHFTDENINTKVISSSENYIDGAFAVNLTIEISQI
jgi:hypothetical protein